MPEQSEKRRNPPTNSAERRINLQYDAYTRVIEFRVSFAP
jgi:hypothetical protein